MKNACVQVGLYKNKFKKRKRKKALFLLVLFLSFFVCSFVYVFCVVNPVVLEASRHAVFSLSTSAVSDAVFDVLTEENITYEDLVNVEKDSDGNISLISLQTIHLNLIARKFYQVAQILLDDMGNVGVNIPLGTFSGLPFLAGVGPNVNLKFTPIGAMTSSFVSKFESAGINQTNHSLYIHLFASVSMILPSYTKTIDSVTEVLVAESVILGKVPQVYLGANNPLSFTPK